MARILVIDDNTDLLDMLKLILHRRGNHEVLLSPNSKEGLQLALEHRPDLAIVDVMMPEMNGYEVVKELRTHEETKNMAVIILTARGQPIDAMAAEQAGADLHMSKPVDAPTLLEKIDQLLEAGQRHGGAVVLPVFSLRGGIGTTTLAVNLALLLQQAHPTVLVDLSPNSGHCALYLGMKPSRHWGPIVRGLLPAEDNDRLRELTLEHESGLHLLAAPSTPSAEMLSAEQTEGLLKALEGQARFIVLDMPSLLAPLTTPIFEAAAPIFLVSGDDPPGLQSTLQTLRALQGHAKRARLILNNVAPGPHPRLEALQRALRVPIVARVPYDPEQATARHRQIPSAMGQPDSPLVQGLQRVVRKILNG